MFKVNKIMWEKWSHNHCFANFELDIAHWENNQYEEKCGPHLQFPQKKVLTKWKINLSQLNYFPVKNRNRWFYHLLLPARAMNCENCHKWELLIVQLHRPSYFKNIRTTSITAFFISNKVVLNPYSHSAASDCQSFAHFLQVSCPLNRCLCLIFKYCATFK